ncbi:MAG: hypothetical protein KGI54_16485 [Pseudomonadota bacterium]|nr:hypothetical protein [Pseudomonadota bacterium]
MTAPLADPMLEAAAQIYAYTYFNVVDCNRDRILKVSRYFMYASPSVALKVVENAARQIDRLRAIGAIPERKDDE